RRMPQDDAAIALSTAAPDPTDVVSRDEFLRVIGAPSNRASGLLRVLLARCHPGAPLPDQLLVIEQLGRFIVAGPGVPTSGHPALVRLQWLVTALEQLPGIRQRFQATLGAVIEATRGVKLLGEIGLPNDRGLLAETTDRLARRLLPEPPATHELWRLAGHIVRRLDDLSWLGPAADDLLPRPPVARADPWEPPRPAPPPATRPP